MPGTQKLNLVWSLAARRDLIRLREFIEPNNPHAARRSSEKIRETTKLIRDNPGIGTRVEGRDDYELFTPFGRYGYILRYIIIRQEIVILRIWHTREDR